MAKRTRRLQRTACAGAGLGAAILLAGTTLTTSQSDQVVRVRDAASAAPAPVPAAATANSVAAAWRPDMKAARRFATSRVGHVSFAVITKDFTRGFNA